MEATKPYAFETSVLNTYYDAWFAIGAEDRDVKTYGTIIHIESLSDGVHQLQINTLPPNNALTNGWFLGCMSGSTPVTPSYTPYTKIPAPQCFYRYDNPINIDHEDLNDWKTKVQQYCNDNNSLGRMVLRGWNRYDFDLMKPQG